MSEWYSVANNANDFLKDGLLLASDDTSNLCYFNHVTRAINPNSTVTRAITHTNNNNNNNNSKIDDYDYNNSILLSIPYQKVKFRYALY